MNSRRDTYRDYRVFQVLWFLFLFFHLLISSPYWLKIGNNFLNASHIFFQLTGLAVLVFAILSFIHPQKIIFFAVSILAFALMKVDVLPRVPNHIHLTLIVILTLLASLALFPRSNSSPEDRIGAWFAQVKPLLQLELLLVYFFTVLHKCNYDFFNPAVSCGASLYHDIVRHYPFLPVSPMADLAIIYASFGLELVIPFLLIIPRTRMIGILTGLVFHYLLAFHSNDFIMSFSAETFALYALFLPVEYIDKVWEIMRHPARMLERAVVLVAALVVLMLAFLLLTQHHLEIVQRNWYRLMGWILDITFLAWYLYGIVVMGGLLSAYLHFRGRSFTGRSIRPETTFLLLFPLLLLVNGFSPYLGLKTATTFSMFSNLYVECERNNHFFMPSGCFFTHYMRDIVTPLRSDHPRLQEIIQAKERMPYLEFQRLLFYHRHDRFMVEYERSGQRYRLTFPTDQQDQYWTAVPWLSKKLILYRNLPPEGPCPCQW